MKRKADIYFVLYLTAIVSFFVVENQVKEYKRTTNKLINRLAFREKLVTVQNASAGVNKDTVIAELALSGDFNPEDFKGDISFKRKNDSVTVKKVPLEKSNGERARFLARIPDAKKVFGEKDTFFLVASLTVKPLITENVRQKWKKDLDAKTASELEKRVSSVGAQEIVETIQETFNVVLNDVKVMPDLPFILSTQSATLNVLQGLDWTTQLSISGVPSPRDYDIDVLQGRTQFGISVQKELVKVILTGSANGAGSVKLRATNRLNGKVSEAAFAINIRTPRFVVQNSPRGFVGDTYTFDGRLESISEDMMRISVSGLYTAQKDGAVLQDIPMTQPGQLVFSIFVNDRKIDALEFRVMVTDPPSPEIKYISYRNKIVTLEVVSYGKVNGQPNSGRISTFLSGARNATKVNERIVNFTTITTFEVAVQMPREGDRIRLELKAKDSRQKESKTFIQEFQVN